MLKTALKWAAVPVALLAATPGSAVVQLTGPSGPAYGTQRGLPTTPAVVEADSSYTYSWLSPESGLLVVSLNPRGSVNVSGGPGRPTVPGDDLAAATMPEPMTWAMMLVGLGVVGWSLRGDRSRRSLRHVSFS